MNKQLSSKIDLECCQKKNNLCKDCLVLLIQNSCPFCRAPLQRKHGRRPRSYSDSVTIISSITHHVDLDDIDVYDNVHFYYARIFRKRRDRLLKLKQREENQQKYSKKDEENIDKCHSVLSKTKKKQLIKNEINDELSEI